MDLVDAVSKWLAAAPDEVRQRITGAATAVEAHPGRKQPKADVNYRKADGEACCENCHNFDGKGGCAVVAGNINPSYVSDKYQGEHGDSSPSAAEPAAESDSDAATAMESDSADAAPAAKDASSD